MVRNLLTHFGDDGVAKLAEDFSTCTEWQAKLFSAIYSESPYSLRVELTSLFLSAKSVRELMIKSAGARRADGILRTAIKKDQSLQMWRINTMKTRSSEPGPYRESDCPTE